MSPLWPFAQTSQSRSGTWRYVYIHLVLCPLTCHGTYGNDVVVRRVLCRPAFHMLCMGIECMITCAHIATAVCVVTGCDTCCSAKNHTNKQANQFASMAACLCMEDGPAHPRLSCQRTLTGQSEGPDPPSSDSAVLLSSAPIHKCYT